MSATNPIVIPTSSPPRHVVWLELSPSPPRSATSSGPGASPSAGRNGKQDLSALIPSTPPRSPDADGEGEASPIVAVFRLPRFTDEDLLPPACAFRHQFGQGVGDLHEEGSEEQGPSASVALDQHQPGDHEDHEEHADDDIDEEMSVVLHQTEAEVDDTRPSDESSELSSVPGDDCSGEEDTSEDGSVHQSDLDFERDDSEDPSVAASDHSATESEAAFTDGTLRSSEAGVDAEQEQRQANKNPKSLWRMPTRPRCRRRRPREDSDSDDDVPLATLLKKNRTGTAS